MKIWLQDNFVANLYVCHKLLPVPAITRVLCMVSAQRKPCIVRCRSLRAPTCLGPCPDSLTPSTWSSQPAQSTLPLRKRWKTSPKPSPGNI